MKKPKITKEIKELAKKNEALRYDSSKESMSEYVERIQKLKKRRK